MSSNNIAISESLPNEELSLQLPIQVDTGSSTPSISAILRCEIESVQLLSSNVGSGAFSEISQVIWYGSYCAGKKISISNSSRSQESDEAFLNYCEIAMTLRHPNLVEFYGVFRPRSACPILVTELMYCSLRHRMNAVAFPPLTFIEKCNIAYSIVCALTYLHSLSPPITHGNLTPDNILLDQQLRTKVSDASLARTLSENQSNMLERYKHVGILAYMPPEADINCSPAIDIFSFGVVFLEMLCEMYPGPQPDQPSHTQDQSAGGNTASALVTENKQTEVERRRFYFNHIGEWPFCSEIIQNCLSDDAELRPTADRIANIFRNKGPEWRNNPPGRQEPSLILNFAPPNEQVPRGSESRTPTEKQLLGSLLNSPSPADPLKSASTLWNTNIDKQSHSDSHAEQMKIRSNPIPGPSAYFAHANTFPRYAPAPIFGGPAPILGPHIPLGFPPFHLSYPPRMQRKDARLHQIPEFPVTTGIDYENNLTQEMNDLNLGASNNFPEQLQQSPKLEVLTHDHVSLPQKIDRCEVIVCDKILFLYDSQEGYTYAFDTSTQTWCDVPQCPRVGAAPVHYKNQLVVLGGKKDPTSTFIGKELFALEYEPGRSNWIQKYIPMLRHRRFAVSFSYKDFIIVIGGDAGLNSVEVYNGTKETWSRAANFIETSRFVDSAVVIQDNAYVLLSAQTKQTLNKYSVIYWTNLAVLNEGIDDLVWFNLDDRIAHPCYALAKWDTYLFAITCVRQSFSELLVFDVDYHKWTYVCNLKIRHTLCGTGVVGSGLNTFNVYILGGNNRENFGDIVTIKSLV